ncbi:MAG: hypothetical protein KGV59_01260 [Tenacibaculum sp.]|nr:hypothetical protein [Tenacibaculum sp.]
MLESINLQIENKIIKSSRGEIFFIRDFIKYGSEVNIRKILSRLEKESVIERIAFGIYLKPKKDEVLGVIYPNLDEIAYKIAKRDKARIVPTGAYALFLLGLTTQIPLNTVYLTDGSQRIVKIGNRSIKFKRTVPKTFAIKDDLLQLVVQSLKEIGQKNCTEDFLLKLQKSVIKISDKTIETELKYAPMWVQKEIKKLYKLN